MTSHLSAFFDRVSEDYDALIEVAIPRCAEVLGTMLYYLPEDFHPRNILELGCGTGNLTKHLAARWPQAEMTLVDISPEMLKKAQQNLPQTRIHPIESAFEDLTLPAGQFDLVVSSFAIHHLADANKPLLLNKLYASLKPGGFLVWADGFYGANERLHQVNMQLYEILAKEKGATEAQLQEWRDHRETLDHYPTLETALDWFHASGFESVDVLWRYGHIGVLQGEKPIQ